MGTKFNFEAPFDVFYELFLSVLSVTKSVSQKCLLHTGTLTRHIDCVALELRKFIHPGIIEETMNGKLFFRSPVSTSTIAVRPFLKDNGRFADSFSLMVFFS